MTFDDKTKTYTLTIMDAYTEDSGEYRCVATNVVGRTTTSCEVTIIPSEAAPVGQRVDEANAPRFRLPLADRTIPAGFECDFVCSVAAVPAPKITWLKNGKPLSPSEYKTKVSLSPTFFEFYVC